MERLETSHTGPHTYSNKVTNMSLKILNQKLKVLSFVPKMYPVISLGVLSLVFYPLLKNTIKQQQTEQHTGQSGVTMQNKLCV